MMVPPREIREGLELDMFCVKVEMWWHVVHMVWENATNNEAEYASLNNGMRAALDRGYTHVSVQGDSQLVHNQVQGDWKVRSANLAPYYNEAKDLSSKFDHFESKHVPRAYNSDADAQANRGANMRGGQYNQEDYY